jgi:hypothetical protein
MHNAIEKPTSSDGKPQGKLQTLTFTGCSHVTTTLAAGGIKFKNIARTTNRTVAAKGIPRHRQIDSLRRFVRMGSRCSTTAPPEPQRPRLPEAALRDRALAGLRGARPEAAGRPARHRHGRDPLVRPPGLRPRRQATGEFLVRVSFTPCWSISHGAGCIIRRGDWTVARANRPGIFRVAADFSVGRAWNAATGASKTC